MKKAQSAMEYLMTYGWAILIVIIVAAALYALGVFNPGTLTGNTATGFPNLGKPSPGDWQYSGTSFTLIMTNNAGSQATIGAAGNTINCGTGGASATLTPTGGTSWGAGGQKTFTATCASLTAGDSYTVNVQINYTIGTFYNVDSGTLTGKAV